MRRTRSNPPMALLVGPIVPYLVIGGAIYFFRDELLKFLTGKGVEAFKADTKTVTTALKSPITTTKDIVKYVTGTQASIASSVKGKNIVVPYPQPQSQAEFRANIDAINKVLNKVAQ